MPKGIITIGISASGKTTWAETFTEDPNWSILCRDDVRGSMLFDMGLTSDSKVVWEKWNWKWEKNINEIIEFKFNTSVAQKKNIIIADTNLKAEYIQAWKDKFTQAGYEIEIKEFPISFEEACKRDAKRLNGVGVSVIAKQWKAWLKYKNSYRYVPNEELPKAIIVDIDGTLAYIKNKERSPFEWNKVGTDKCDSVIADIVRSMELMGYKIIIMSGRDSVCREQTQYWLKDNHLWYHKLLMRTEGDMRKDSIIKEELFNEVKDKYNIVLVIDDRPVVCRMWRDLGLNVLQKGNPYIEF